MKLIETPAFVSWMRSLRDQSGRIRIATRLRRLQLGNPGDIKPIGHGVSELRIDHGPGYRVYLSQRDSVLVILLCGGDKSTQAADIAKAKIFAQEDHDDI